MQKIYKYLKAIHPFTAFLAFCACLASAGTSDYYTMELYSTAPKIADILLIWGFVLMIPSALVMFFDYIKANNVDNKRK